MPSYSDLMKYARTGIASPDMTGFDKLMARAAFGSYPISTITGVPPISFKSDGKPLTAWSMLGNGQQTGTPTPDAPIMPEFVGVRTGNLAPPTWAQDFVSRVNDSNKAHIEQDEQGRMVLWYDVSVGYGDFDNKYIFKADFKPDTQYAIRLSGMRPSGQQAAYVMAIQYTDGTQTNKYATADGNYQTLTAVSSVGKTIKYIRSEYSSGTFSIDINTFMCVEGTTAPETYEPYGYKIPVTNAGEPVPVYLGQTQTVRRVRKLVLTGEETSWVAGTTYYTVRIVPEIGFASSKAVCTHAPYDTGVSVNSDGTVLYFRRSVFSDYEDINAFKSYLAQQYAAGTPVTVWYVLPEPQTAIINEPLCKIGDYADELHSTDAGVTIPTAKGANTLTVDTTLQPSAVSVTGHIKAI